ncbi:MAG: OmpA family protein [Polyangiales bacterium]
MERTHRFTDLARHAAGAGALASLLLTGCAASGTPHLADARKAYDDAASGPARTRAPGALAEARVALDRAEQAHNTDPGSAQASDLALRAERAAEYADARGDARAEVADQRNLTRAERAELARDRAESRERAVRDDHRYEAQRQTPRRANAAMQSLAQVANVKEEPRGVVITLSGGLLFPTGEEEMSPVGSRSVDQVAHALAQQPKDSNFQVEGYTDSSGSDDANRDLSAKRAQAVADRLADQGIDSSRISVAGRGEAAPIADNDTAEGRASNRRVEIVVSRDHH